MATDRDDVILEAAEDVVAGVIPMRAAEAGLANERERAELRSLVRALTVVRSHAAALADLAGAPGPAAAPTNATPTSLDVPPARVHARRVTAAPGRFAWGGLGAAVAVFVVAGIVGTSIGRAPAVGGPATASPRPSAEPSAAPSPTAVAAEGLPPIVSGPLRAPHTGFWTVEGGTIHVLVWDPMTSQMVETAAVATWEGPDIERSLLFAPNGAHFAVHEINIATSSPVQRVRIFTFEGSLAWEAPAEPRLPLVTALAWSPDGTALAIGSLPVPWTVVQLSETGAEAEVTTYELDAGDGYHLLGFSVDGNTLYGYGTSGEAEYWQKLFALDRARGRVRSIQSIPEGPAALSWSNSTAPVGRFSPDGAVLTRPGAARGDPAWAVRIDGGADVPVPIDQSVVLTWSADGQLVGLGAGVDGDGRPTLRLDLLDPITGEAGPQPALALPPGDYRADLLGARDGFALLSLLPFPSLVPKEAVLVDLATGRVAVGLPPADLAGDGELQFGGWLGRRD